MNDKEKWDNWAKTRTDTEAVMMASSLIRKYRDYIEKKVLLPIFKKYINKNDIVLEMGCGNGRWIKRLEENGIKKLIGIDFSKELIRQAKSKCKATFFISNSYGLCLSNSKFDNTVLLQVIPHNNIKKLRVALNEACRVTKINGKIILMDEFVENDIEDVKKIMLKNNFKLVKIKPVRSEWLSRLITSLRKQFDKSYKESSTISTKNTWKHFIKVILEAPIDLLLLNILLKKLSLESVLVFNGR